MNVCCFLYLAAINNKAQNYIAASRQKGKFVVWGAKLTSLNECVKSVVYSQSEGIYLHINNGQTYTQACERFNLEGICRAKEN